MKRLVQGVWLSIAMLLASAAMAQSPQPQARQPFTQRALDEMLAPIALYPDSLLSLTLMAATYPRDVVEAAEWSRNHPEARGGEAAVRAAENEPWDSSVVSLTAFPQVLALMDDRRYWMESLGEAFIEQQQQVMDTVQALRARADGAGNLRASEEIVVQRQGDDYLIEPSAPDVMYVPDYDPRYVYSPGYSGFGWGYGIGLGTGFFFSAIDWPRRYLRYSSHRPWYFHGRDYRRGDRWTHNRDPRWSGRDSRWRDANRDPRWSGGDNRWRNGDRDPRWNDRDNRWRNSDRDPRWNDRDNRWRNSDRDPRWRNSDRDARWGEQRVARPAAPQGNFAPNTEDGAARASTTRLQVTRPVAPRYSADGVARAPRMQQRAQQPTPASVMRNPVERRMERRAEERRTETSSSPAQRDGNRDVVRPAPSSPRSRATANPDRNADRSGNR